MSRLLQRTIAWCLLVTLHTAEVPCPKTSRLYGPGLQPQDIVLPCRYFTVELRDNEGERISTSPGSNVIDVSIVGHSNRSQHAIPIRHEILDAGDGTFIVRYKTFSTFLRLDISVTLSSSQQHLSGSPLTVDEPVHSSVCSCPHPDFDKWFASYGCRKSHPQIDADLEPFKTIDMPAALEEAKERFRAKGSFSFCHYVVKANRIYRQCFGEHVGFKMFPDATLSFLSRIVTLPDTEFLINLGDWPLVRKGAAAAAAGPPVPMISWCKTNETFDVLLPTYELTEATTECMGRQVLDMLSVQGNANVAWEARIEKAFFKGRDSSEERLELIRIAKSNPDLIEAGITKYFFFREKEEELGSVDPTSFFDFFKFKYQINMDGTVAAYRFPFLMAGGSLIFKQESPYFEHFYNNLQPWKHYVPLKRDISDLVEKIKWAKEHEGEARKIAQNAKAFANDHLLPREVICYHALLLKEWRKRLKYPAAVLSQMDKVEESAANSNFDCTCEKKKILPKKGTTKNKVKEEL